MSRSSAGGNASRSHQLWPFSRREFVAGALYASLLAGRVSSAQEQVFGFEQVAELARTQAKQSYQPADTTLKPPFADLGYDAYRNIRFRKDARLFGAEDTPFSLDLLPPGHLFNEPVEIAVVDEAGVRPIAFSADYFHFSADSFDFPDGRAPTGTGKGSAFSGFRLRYPLNSPDVMDEFAVYQGASYFRAVARTMLYGLSARGLAIGTADSKGEEFPVFRRFWIHEPAPEARVVLVQALLDSPSCAGAFEFEISPGETTVMQTRCRLFPRAEIGKIGIAPLTSMYFFSPERRGRIDDYRSAVHDSSSLQMITGSGKRLLRPLSNPSTLQISSFQDADPKGFGLVQRHRDFAYYQDAEALYHRRPGAWVEPLGDWGPGAVVLVEIPARTEFNDNIVCFWRPAESLKPSDEGHQFDYRLHWCAEPPDAVPLARVAATRSGVSIHREGVRDMVIDFRKAGLDSDPLKPKLWTSAGKVGKVTLQDLPGGELLRASFTFEPGDVQAAEMALKLEGPEGDASEVWLYRWTARR